MNLISSKNSKIAALAVSMSLSLTFCLSSTALGKQKPSADKGSLEEMWIDKSIVESSKPDAKGDQPLEESKKQSEGLDTTSDFKIRTPEEGDIQEEEELDSSQEPRTESKKKPLCTLKELKESVFVKSGGWPGVGPFQSTDSESEFSDNFKNRLTLKKTEQNEVSEAQLRLVNLSGNSQDVLSLEMSCDFLLEALGARDGKIADFNSRFEEKQNQLKDLSKEKLTFNAGPLEVSIAQDKKEDAASDKPDYLISVVSTEPYTKPISKPDTTDSTTEKPDTKETADLQPVETTETSPTNTSILDKPIVYPAKNQTTKVAMVPKTNEVETGGDPLKKQFEELMN